MIQTQPSATATAGEAFEDQPVIYEEDQYGNLETGDNTTSVTASLGSGAGRSRARQPSPPKAAWRRSPACADTTAETITLSYSGGDFTAGPSTVVVNPAAASKLVIQTQPSATATAGQAFATQPVLYLEDQYNNLETGDNTTSVTVSLGSGAGPLAGHAKVTVQGGVATFAGLADTTAGDHHAQLLCWQPHSRAVNGRHQSGGRQQAGDPNAAVANRHGGPGVRSFSRSSLKRISTTTSRRATIAHTVTAAAFNQPGPMQWGRRASSSPAASRRSRILRTTGPRPSPSNSPAAA